MSGLITATTASDVTSTTAVTVIAAPDTARAIYLHRVTVTNKTSGENPIIYLKDTQDTPATVDHFAMGDIGDADVTTASVTRVYSPPKRIAAGKALTAEAGSATGDCVVTADYELGQ